jgi:hypothetical protein
MYQCAVRAYGDSIRDFLKGLKPVRERLVNAMAQDGLVVSQ